MNYRVGTRGSKLAIRQTELVIDRLKKAFPEDSFETVVIHTTGDKNLKSALSEIGSKGVFVDTIEKALIDGSIHFAVHSMKDMPDETLNGLTFAKSWAREDPRDALILREAGSLDELPKGARIATGSLRRIYQLKKLRPDLEYVPIRGNIDTRIRKLSEPCEDGKFLDGIVLAVSGLKRLGRENEITCFLSVDEMIPAPGQGTLAIELREDSTELLRKINSLSDDETDSLIKLERGFLKQIGASCHDPVGAYASYNNGCYSLKAIFGTPDGTRIAITEVNGSNADGKLIDEAVSMISKQMLE